MNRTSKDQPIFQKSGGVAPRQHAAHVFGLYQIPTRKLHHRMQALARPPTSTSPGQGPGAYLGGDIVSQPAPTQRRAHRRPLSVHPRKTWPRRRVVHPTSTALGGQRARDELKGTLMLQGSPARRTSLIPLQQRHNKNIKPIDLCLWPVRRKHQYG